MVLAAFHKILKWGKSSNCKLLVLETNLFRTCEQSFMTLGHDMFKVCIFKCLLYVFSIN